MFISGFHYLFTILSCSGVISVFVTRHSWDFFFIDTIFCFTEIKENSHYKICDCMEYPHHSFIEAIVNVLKFMRKNREKLSHTSLYTAWAKPFCFWKGTRGLTLLRENNWTGNSRKSAGAHDINDWIQLSCFSFRVLILSMRAHWHKFRAGTGVISSTHAFI